MLTEREQQLTKALRKLAIVPATLRRHRLQNDPQPDGKRCLLCRATWFDLSPETHVPECLLEQTLG